jgi:SAM-dependent methyltransferase
MASQDVWADLHKHYRMQDWIDKPSLFAAQVIDYFPAKSDILELGAGLGQDSHFFAAYGLNVIATDLEQTLLDIDNRKESADVHDRVQFMQMDMSKPFPCEDNSFDVVYAHLSLHYFDKATTKHIFAEIERVLKPQGWLAFLVNSTSDPEYNTGTLIEPDFFQIDRTAKRYFSVESVAEFVQRFDARILDDKGETYKDSMKGVHHLIRFLGQKKLN